MITIFTIPKPFRGDINIIQRNSIRSWLRLQPGCEVIILGDEAGAADTAAEFGIRHIPGLQRNQFGTPLINSAFDAAQQKAAFGIMCYINADIILLGDFAGAVQRVRKLRRNYLLAGQRWDLDLKEAFDFEIPDWEDRLRSMVSKSGSLHSLSGMDYFVFPRGQYQDMPAFAVGRPAWDNWLIYRTRFLRIPVINGTEGITAVHQNHGYGHVAQSTDGFYNGPEGQRNLELAGGYRNIFTLKDSTLLLAPQGLHRPQLTFERLYRELDILPEMRPGWGLAARWLSRGAHLARKAWFRLGSLA